MNWHIVARSAVALLLLAIVQILLTILAAALSAVGAGTVLCSQCTAKRAP
ncbi:MAG TPA: hypothetical protein VGJ15_04345 [Pirellulales bacterium]